MNKKSLLLLACLCISTTIIANEKDERSRWYIQAEAGITNTGTDNMNIGTISGNIGFTGGLEFGYQFNHWFGLAADMKYARVHAKDDTGAKYGLDAVEPSLNAEFNLLNLIDYKKERKNFINLYLGITSAYCSSLPDGYRVNDFKDNNFTLGFRAGLQYERSLKNNWALIADAGINSFNDQFEHSKKGGLDSHLDIQIGIRKYLGNGHRSRRDDYVTTEVKYYDKIINDTIVKKINVKKKDDMYSIFFHIDKIDILPSEVGKIKDVADFLKSHPEKVVFVFGYADKNTGTAKRNAWLAKNRARVICEQLTNTYGIDSSRIISYDQGDKVQPFEEKEFEKNRATICIITDLKQ